MPEKLGVVYGRNIWIVSWPGVAMCRTDCRLSFLNDIERIASAEYVPTDGE
jgi:hypothetical protein